MHTNRYASRLLDAGRALMRAAPGDAAAAARCSPPPTGTGRPRPAAPRCLHSVPGWS
jgi:hypothetical protein